MADKKKKEKADFLTRNRKEKAPFVLLLTALMLAVAIITGIFQDVSEATKAIDDRNPKHMAKDVYHQRDRLEDKSKGMPSEATIEGITKGGVEQMKLVGLMPSEKPMTCPNDSLLDVFKDTDSCVKKAQGVWEENNKTRGKYVFLFGLPPAFPNLACEDARKRGMTKFIFHTNMEHYVACWRHNFVTHKFDQMGFNADANKAWRRQIGWIKDQFDKSPDAKKKGKERSKAYAKHVDKVFLSLPLVSPKWINKHAVKTWEGTTWQDGQDLKKADAAVSKAKKELASKKDDKALKKALDEAIAARDKILDRGRPCLLVKPLAEMVTRANRRMYNAIGSEIRPMTCWRSNLQQAMLWIHIRNGKASLPEKQSLMSKYNPLANKVPKVALPGQSNHEQGLAMDVQNMAAARPYLAAEAGMMCDFIPDDAGHCSIAEITLNPSITKCKEAMDAFAFAGKKAYNSKLGQLVRWGVKSYCRYMP